MDRQSTMQSDWLRIWEGQPIQKNFSFEILFQDNFLSWILGIGLHCMSLWGSQQATSNNDFKEIKMFKAVIGWIRLIEIAVVQFLGVRLLVLRADL